MTHNVVKWLVLWWNLSKNVAKCFGSWQLFDICRGHNFSLVVEIWIRVKRRNSGNSFLTIKNFEDFHQKNLINEKFFHLFYGRENTGWELDWKYHNCWQLHIFSESPFSKSEIFLEFIFSPPISRTLPTKGAFRIWRRKEGWKLWEGGERRREDVLKIKMNSQIR